MDWQVADMGESRIQNVWSQKSMVSFGSVVYSLDANFSTMSVCELEIMV